MSKGTWARVRAQLGAWKEERAAQGTRAASVHRARQALDLGPVTTGRVDTMSHQIDELHARTEVLEARSDELGGTVERAAHEAQRATKAAFAAGGDDETAVLLQQVVALAAWLDAMPPAHDALISIVLPTRGTRPEHLARAVESVRRQQHERWEILVTVDGTDERTAAVTAQLPDDERIRVLRSVTPGVSAARNAGIDVARGDLVAYLDDDNVMGPAWLRAISWAADRHPDDELFYGAEVVGGAAERGGGGALPTVHLAPFDRNRLRRGNYIDQNVVAHRRTLAEAHYDESLAANVDWDFLLRATASRDPVVVPAIASVYGTDAADRLTDSDEARESWPVVHERANALRPLRVLAVNREYPHLTETYIHDDLHALEMEGAEIACFCFERRPAPIPNPYPFYDDLDRAIAEFEPDVLLTHWAAYVRIHHEQIAGKGVPYVVRPHSFSAERDAMIELLEDPRCLAAFAPAHFGLDHPKAKQLPVLFTRVDELPPPAATRDLVLSVSAGLPKKDFPLLLEAFGKLDGVERRMILGTSSDHETYPGEVVQLAKAMLDDPPLIQMNLTRDQVFEQLARAVAFVYVLRPEAGFSCPIGVIEAMASGVPVIMPDRPDVRATFDAARTYRTADDIVEHVRTLLAGGPLVEAEREATRAFALERFCSAEDRKRFYTELAAAVAAAPSA